MALGWSAGLLRCCLALPLLPLLAPAVLAEPRAAGLLPKQKKVGPNAIGAKPKATVHGATLRDGDIYAFAKQVPSSAIYDGFKVEGAHILIENIAFDGRLDIYTSKPVVLRGVTIHLAHSDPFALLTRPGAGPVLVLYVSVGASDENDAAANIGTAVALHSDGATVYRSSISGAADGIQISGSRIRIAENVIRTRKARRGDHNDGIQLLKTPSDVTIIRNRITNPNPETSCIMILGNRIRVEENVLSGSGWSIYGGDNNNGHGGGSAKAVVIKNNVFKRMPFANGGYYGIAAYWNTANIWTGNRFDDATLAEPAKTAKRSPKKP